MQIKIATDYSPKFLQVERPKPLSDRHIESEIQKILHGNWDHDITDQVYTDFKQECEEWIFNSKLNNLKGIDTFTRKDVIIGCTQFIDNLYMQGPVQVLRGDYRYHERLGLAYVKDVGSLIPSIPLIIAMPFPSIGAPHQDIGEILEECRIKNIHVHVDGAWLTCSRSISFDFNHESIRSVGVSLSKGLGLGWNRIGLRWTKERINDSISIMNDFHMENRMPIMVANYVLDNVSVDYLWKTHGHVNRKICKDFNLTPSNAIHMAFKQDGTFVGLSPLIRYLNNE